MKEGYFFSEKIELAYAGEKIGKNEIDEIDDFPGREDFINFYSVYNGVNFINGAWFVPEECYSSSLFGKPYLTLTMFLRIRVGDKKEGLNIDVMNDIITEKYRSFEDFVLFHIPFALDVTDNPFWIDIQTGEIKYMNFQLGCDPDDVIPVAGSFKNFCKRITNRKIPY